MTLDLHVSADNMQFRCLQCKAIIEPMYLGIDAAGDPRFSFRCPVCGEVVVYRMHRATGLPEHPVFDHRGS